MHPDNDPTANVLVVQDYTFAKYLGRLDVTFDEDGKVTEWSGNPVLLDYSITQGKCLESFAVLLQFILITNPVVVCLLLCIIFLGFSIHVICLHIPFGYQTNSKKNLP